MELWDAYDSHFNKISAHTLIRGEAIPDGMYHLVCDALVRHTDGSYLIMKRSAEKTYGGMWEASAGGSALCGEEPIDCIRRELLEETGLLPLEITEVGRIVHHLFHSLYVEYLVITDCDKNAITLQEGENCGYRWITREELISMPRGELVTNKMHIFLRELR